MSRNEIIAKVALDFVKDQLEAEPEGTLRFCILGISNEVVVEIARAALADPFTSKVLLVRIPNLFTKSGALPPEVISDESITHWRHCRLKSGKRGVLFAASHEELQRNDKSVEKITRIETDRLRELY